MYHRTQNDNGSFNSRCLDCLLTIASYIATEPELEEREVQHRCPEKALSELMSQQRAAVSHAARN